MIKKLAVSFLMVGLALAACGGDPAPPDEGDSGGKGAGGVASTGGKSGSGGKGGTSANGGSGGSSSNGGSPGSGGSASGGSPGSGGSASGGSASGGSVGSGGSPGSGGSASGGSASGGSASGGSPGSGGSSTGGTKVDWGNDCGPSTNIQGVSASAFCTQYAKACGFAGADRYASVADCMSKYMALSEGPTCAKACVSGHLCYASDTMDKNAAPTYCPHISQASSANGPCKPSYTGCP
jgi:hypothetical protein